MKSLNLKKLQMGWLKIVIVVFLVVLAAFAVSVGLAPVYKINELKSLAMADSSFMKTYDKTNDFQELQNLNRDIALSKALVNLSTSDSIVLIVNLRDSMVGLSIHGVIIHKTPLKKFEAEPLLANLPNWIYVQLFSVPLQIIDEYTTIVKEPIVVREAPKNAEEAALNAYEPDTLIQNPAFLRMSLDNNIQLVFEQEENENSNDRAIRSEFRSAYFYKRLNERLAAFFSLRKQEYVPTITIQIPADDLREIYRALPVKADVVLSL